MSTTLLDELYNSEFAKIKGRMAGKRVSLSVDGWSGPCRDPMLGMALTVGCTTYLTVLEDCPAPHTAERIAERIIEYVDDVETLLECKVVSIATDNASNMQKARSLVLEQKPHLFGIGCQAHWLNLLAKEVLNGSTLVQIIMVARFVRETHKDLGELRRRDIPLPPMPGDTRWNLVPPQFRLVPALRPFCTAKWAWQFSIRA